MSPKRLYAPQTDRAVVADPVPEQWAAVLEANRLRSTEHDGELQGRSWQRLRKLARDELIRAAWRYTRSIVADLRPLQDHLSGPVVATGHQPELFHPGVWIKNFATDRLARVVGGVALNLVVDNDRLKNLAVRVPAGPVQRPRVQLVPLDRWQGDLPYEEHTVADERVFASFGARVSQAVRTLGIEPLIEQLWPHAVELAGVFARLGERVAGARRLLEGHLGLRVLELPISALCGTEAFLWFACHLMAHAERFRQVHNAALAHFRQAMRIRNPARPVPDLVAREGWCEVPFWVWHKEDRTRRPLYVQVQGRCTLLSDGAGWQLELPLGPELEACCAVERLKELQLQGRTKIRTRALTTTLFVRLFACDLFIHGLGGAIYDRITDELICRFYELPVPEFATLSATVYLPVERPKVDRAQVAALRQELRALLYNPQRFLSFEQLADPTLHAYVERKRQLMAWHPATRAERRERFEAFRQVNAVLRRPLAERIEAVRRELARYEQQLEVKQVLENREYPFCTYPLDELTGFYEGFCQRIGSAEALPSQPRP